MLIRDIILTEANEDLLGAVEDILALAMSKDIRELKTDKMVAMLAKRGFVVSKEELIHAAQNSNYVSSVDMDKISTSDSMGNNVDTGIEVPVDVGDMASDQAMSDIKKDI